MSSTAIAVTTGASVTTAVGIATAQNANRWLAPSGWKTVDSSYSTPSIFTWFSPYRSLSPPLPCKTREVVYNILFRAAAETLRTIAADPKHLGAQIGFFSVLHTWGQALFHHPHLHCVVPGGGISTDGTRWISCRSNFFLPVAVLARLFRRLFLDYLQQAFDGGDLQFFSSLEPLRIRNTFLRYLAPIRKKDWVVYAKRPFAGPEEVLKYVARYTHRIAITNNRLLDINDGKVQFRWKDYRDGSRYKTMTLGADEFIRRFLLHVLPDGFQRIRYFGFLANRYRAEKLALCRQLMQMPPPTAAHEANTDYRDRYEALTGFSLRTCSLCRCGTMVVIETFKCTSSHSGYVVTINSSNSPSHIDRPCAITRTGRFCFAQLHISFPRRFCCPCLLSLHRAHRRIGSNLPLFFIRGCLLTSPQLHVGLQCP